jgi:hypothetical protein
LIQGVACSIQAQVTKVMKLDLSLAAVLFRALSDAVAQMVKLRRQALAGDARASALFRGGEAQAGLGSCFVRDRREPSRRTQRRPLSITSGIKADFHDHAIQHIDLKIISAAVDFRRCQQ